MTGEQIIVVGGGVLDAAGEKVRSALLASTALPRDIVESAIKGHSSSKK